jgi:hypothetical protein
MKRIFYYLFFALLVVGCRDKYELPLRENDVSLLVVEGTLNAGQGPTTITLSRTVQVADAVTFKPELNATLIVEGKNGGSSLLTEMGGGRYLHPQLSLTIGDEYRLRIRARNGKEYLSEYVVARQTPQIDAITWKKEEEGLRIFANTHDVSNNTRYYKWDYDETWEIRSYYTAFYRWTGGTNIVYSPFHNNRCWKYSSSNNIIIGSTAQLQSDVMSEAPLLYIPPGSEKLGVRYSILVKQQSLTKGAYEYLQLMKKNTESIGTIFDPQPSELKGNIQCVSDPEEGVIGYLTASTVTEKRIFITATEAGWRYTQTCPPEKVKNHPDSIKEWVPGYLPYDSEVYMSTVDYYSFAKAACVDCTARGGNLSQPSYW